MSKQVDKIKKELYKRERLKGKSIVRSMVNAGYAVSTANQGQNAVSRQGEAELMNQVKLGDITVEWVVNRLTQELVAKDAKASDRIRVSELLGKYLNMFKDSQNTQVSVFTGDMIADLPRIDITEPPKAQEVITNNPS